MRRTGLVAVILLGAVAALAACDRGEKAKPKAAAAAAPALQGFQHEPGFDVQGFYRSEAPVQAGNLKLNLIAIGAPSDFQTWESGARDGMFGPIWMLFDDVTSPPTTNEIGHGSHAVTVRVLPESYTVSPGKVTFRGKDARLGEVVFEGAFDTAAFAQAKESGTSEDKPVLSGSLRIGETRIPNVALAYWVGD